VQLVAAGENFLLLVGTERVLHHGFVLVGAEDEAESGAVSGCSHFLVEVVDVELELAEVLVDELAGLQFNQDVGFEDGVIEDEIDVEMVAVQGDSLLTSDECETFSEFQNRTPIRADASSGSRIGLVNSVRTAYGIPEDAGLIRLANSIRTAYRISSS
jgi:hypothetical protein